MIYNAAALHLPPLEYDHKSIETTRSLDSKKGTPSVVHACSCHTKLTKHIMMALIAQQLGHFVT